jgi:hypothetical protein
VAARHAGESSEPVDHLGGILSVVFIGPLVLAISLLPNYGFNGTVLGLFAVSLVGLVLFVARERRTLSPLFDLKVLRARTFTIALVGGTITWAGLLGATFIGQQYTQNVLGYSPLSAALITLPAAVFVAAAARPAGRMITSRGSRVPLALGLAVTARLPRNGLAVRHDRLGGRRRDRLRRAGPRDRPGRPTLVELADGLGPGGAGRHGLGLQRPAAGLRRGAVPGGAGVRA